MHVCVCVQVAMNIVPSATIQFLPHRKIGSSPTPSHFPPSPFPNHLKGSPTNSRFSTINFPEILSTEHMQWRIHVVTCTTILYMYSNCTESYSVIDQFVLCHIHASIIYYTLCVSVCVSHQRKEKKCRSMASLLRTDTGGLCTSEGLRIDCYTAKREEILSRTMGCVNVQWKEIDPFGGSFLSSPLSQ